MNRSRGREARSPFQIPAAGWLDVIYRSIQRVVADNLTFSAAGAAFYGLIAIVPGLVGTLLLAVRWLDPEQVARLLETYSAVIPGDVRGLIQNQIDEVRVATESHFLFGTFILAVYGASRGTGALIHTLNIAYGEEESRSFLRLQMVVLLMSVVVLLLAVVSLLILVLMPVAIGILGERLLSLDATVLFEALRWPAIWLVGFVSLTLSYRFAPSRRKALWRFVFVGAAVASSLWLFLSFLFSIYTERFASFGETYGVLGTPVVVLLWLWLSNVVMLFGAVLNCELERQTRIDSTIPPDRPMGERDAWAADELGKTLR